MKSLLSIVLVFVLVCQVAFCGHSGEIDDYKTLTSEEQGELQMVINEWDRHNCTCTHDVDHRVNFSGYVFRHIDLYTYGDPHTGSSIDLQDIEVMDQGSSSFAKIFHRYAVRQGSGTYAVVHIEHGVRFGVYLIRESFSKSRNSRAHVFLARENVTVNLPNDGKQYVSGLITRKIVKEINKIVVWSTRDVVDALLTNLIGTTSLG